MKYQRIEQVGAIATLRSMDIQPMSALDRLERWASLLERGPERQLATLRGTEYWGVRERAKMRRDNTPISVAFADPILRAEGMRDDTYGEAMRFFELSDRQMHNILCHCRFGELVSSGLAARTIRRIVSIESQPGFFGKLKEHLAGWRIGA